MALHDSSWRQRCNRRMEELKNTQFSSQDAASSSHPGNNVKIQNLLLQIPFPADLPQCLGNSPLHAAILDRKPVNQGRMIFINNP
ncbi:hypothetical protein JHK82_016825 [Glycine max]|nr:hypothetical protein JHK82_016825 [Glycine max]